MTPTSVSLLDVGTGFYGACLLVRVHERTVLIDGGHRGEDRPSPNRRSIPDQLRSLCDVSDGPVPIDLVVITHLHNDHIGCLPELVGNGAITCANALALDPSWRWDAGAPRRNLPPGLLESLAEEPLPLTATDDEITNFIAEAAALEQRYRDLLNGLAGAGELCLYPTDCLDDLRTKFKSVGLSFFGPSSALLKLTRDRIRKDRLEATRVIRAAIAHSVWKLPGLYREVVSSLGANGAAVNLQSIVMALLLTKHRGLFTGDMQLADPGIGDPGIAAEIDALRSAVRKHAPYAFVALPHHGSHNGFDDDLMQELGDTSYFGIATGTDRDPRHPDPAVLDTLAAASSNVCWVRTDRNSLSTFTFAHDVTVEVESGSVNDVSPNPP